MWALSGASGWVIVDIMRIGLALFGSVSLFGCYSQPTHDGTEGATDASSDTTADATETSPTGQTSSQPDTGTAPTTDASNTNPTAVDSSSGGSGDQPPIVVLEVDGSAAPRDLVHAGHVALTAEAMDDGTVARVELYDGADLLATIEAPPYAAEVLLTSADAGTHTFTARAFDDADQMGESDPVDLAVTIEGGATVASATNLFQMGGISFHPGIGAVLDDADNVIVVGSLTTSGFAVTGVGAISLSPDLGDTNWQMSVPMSLVDGAPQYLTLGAPVMHPSGAAIAIGGNVMGTDGVLDPNASIFPLHADGSGPLPFVQIPSNPDAQNIALAGIVGDGDGNVFLAGPDDDLTKIDAMPGGSTLWQSPVGHTWTTADLGGYRIRADVEGDAIFDVFTCSAAAPVCTLETRKINGFDGNELWSDSVQVNDTDYFMHVGGSTTGPDAQVLTLHGPALVDGGGLRMVLRDADGGMLEDMLLGGDGDRFSVADLAYDEQGYIVAVGTMLPGGDVTMRQPFAVRFDEAGNVLWQRSFSFGTNDDQAMALALDRNGRVVVVGIADIETIFIVFLGDVWVAQLDL
jgi:hypothetical protein